MLLSRTDCVVRPARRSPASNGVGLSVDDDVFELEVGDAGGAELVVLDGGVEILEEDVADVGLAGVGPDGAEGGVRALDADEVDVLDDGLGRLHALEIEILRPRRHVDDAARWAFGGNGAEGDVLVMLGVSGRSFRVATRTPPVILQSSAMTSRTMVASLPQVRTPPPRLKVQLRTRMCSTAGLSLSSMA